MIISNEIQRNEGGILKFLYTMVVLIIMVIVTWWPELRQWILYSVNESEDWLFKRPNKTLSIVLILITEFTTEVPQKIIYREQSGPRQLELQSF